ncbi:hypothetical protein Tco_0578181 [Tanacetum coccineum]
MMKKKNFRKLKEDKKEKDDRRCFKCGDPNQFISDCPKHSFNDQKAFVVGCWSDSGDDSKKEEICLMALDNNEVLSDTPYYSSSFLDNESWENKYDKLCKIISKNKQLKAKNEVLKKEACELKTKVEQLERNKEISLECESCVNLQSKISSLTLKLASFKNSSSSLQEMLEMQKPPKDKYGLGYTEDITSTRNTKIKKLGPENIKMPSVEPASPVPSAREPASSDEPNRPSAENLEKAKNVGSNILKKNYSVLITRKSTLNTSKSFKQPPILKLGQGLGKSKIQTHPRTLHRNSNTLYPKSNYHQVGWNYGTQQEYQFQPTMINQWGPCPPYPYMSQPNVNLEPDEWINDSGCSRHMTGNKDLFSSYKTIDGEPINVKEAIQDESWTMAMQEYLNQFKTNDIWSLVPPPENQTLIEAPKTSHLEAVKRIFRYIKGTSQLGLWYPKGTGVETIVYADSDHAGDYVDRKSTSGVCTFMGCCLTLWFSKKQTAPDILTTEAEYVSAGKACQQALWMKQALVDYDINLDDIPAL